VVEDKMKKINQKIIDYLRQHGKMSGRDICDDLSIDEVDVILAAQGGSIQSASPEPGGSGSWYTAKNHGEK